MTGRVRQAGVRVEGAGVRKASGLFLRPHRRCITKA
jgi:hypothetical protein